MGKEDEIKVIAQVQQSHLELMNVSPLVDSKESFFCSYIYSEAIGVPHLCRWRLSLWSSGGEHISRLVETRYGKKIFLQTKNFLLMPL
jgi:hypothetical protein